MTSCLLDKHVVLKSATFLSSSACCTELY